MRLSDLQKKDVININDGTKIGNIIDIKIDESNGKIDSLVIEKTGFSFNIFTPRGEIDIHFNQIQKIGEDVIIVRIDNM
jgi:YlmC/YmxH family sporulation protein